MQLLIIYDESRTDSKRFVRFLMKNDQNKMFCYTTMQSYVAQILMNRNQLSVTDLPVLVSGEKIYTGADVLTRSIAHFDSQRRLLSLLRLLPRRWRSRTVNFILSKDQDI